MKPISCWTVNYILKFGLHFSKVVPNANFDNLEMEDKLRFIMQHKDLQ